MKKRPEREKNLKRKISETPDIPGVYIMKDGTGCVIYVGKAVSLRNRIRSYFHAGGGNTKNLLLSASITDFDVVPVSSEAEALILENSLIKRYQPKYNVSLKDGKTYPFVKVTCEKFPSLQIVREKMDIGSAYFGPFTNVDFIKSLVKLVRRYYPIRDCRYDIEKRNVRLCTQYHIGRCSGPCEGKVSESDYRHMTDGVLAFFDGQYNDFKKRLGCKLKEAVDRLEFEKASEINKRIFMLEEMGKKFPVRDEESLLRYSETNELQRLQDILSLGRIPYHIEGFDVSNISGVCATASKVSFKGGAPDRASYRRYRILYDIGADDYRMIEEVLRRRFKAGKGEGAPDLILVDGGKGHLNTACRVLKDMGVEVPVVSLAKEDEELFMRGVEKPVAIGRESAELFLLQRIRDEAHRFAVSYHRNLRKKSVRLSFLDEIGGIGPVRKGKIMRRFNTAQELAGATILQLTDMGVPRAAAKEVIAKANLLVVRARKF